MSNNNILSQRLFVRSYANSFWCHRVAKNALDRNITLCFTFEGFDSLDGKDRETKKTIMKSILNEAYSSHRWQKLCYRHIKRQQKYKKPTNAYLYYRYNKEKPSRSFMGIIVDKGECATMRERRNARNKILLNDTIKDDNELSVEY